MKKIFCLLCVLVLGILSSCAGPSAPAVEPSAAPEAGWNEDAAAMKAPDKAGSDVEESPAPDDAVLSQGPEANAVIHSDDGKNLKFLLPEGWSWQEMLEDVDAEDSMQRAAVYLWHDDAPDARVTLWCTQSPVGICGTGVTFDEIGLEDGRVIATGTERIGEKVWFFWHIADGTDMHIYMEGSLAPEMYEEYEKDLIAVMESTEASLSELE